MESTEIPTKMWDVKFIGGSRELREVVNHVGVSDLCSPDNDTYKSLFLTPEYETGMEAEGKDENKLINDLVEQWIGEVPFHTSDLSSPVMLTKYTSVSGYVTFCDRATCECA